HPDRAMVLNALATVDQLQGRNAEARVHLEQAIAINEKALGADHPKIATSVNLLGVIAVSEGDLEGARRYFEHALEIREKFHGPDHPEVAGMLINLGILMSEAERWPESRAYLERGLAILERLRGSSSRDLTHPLLSLGFVATAEGDFEKAHAYLERTRAILEEAKHPDLAEAHVYLGALAKEEGKLDDALANYQRAIEIRSEALGEDHPYLADPLTKSGEVWLELGQHAKALPLLERALTLIETRDFDPVELARTRFELARALWQAPGSGEAERARSHELAEQALQAYAEGGERAADEHEAVAAWLAAHPS
ncbi:MAG: tetratricopeptide repeat protein, partial [Myxococcales bacterium]|nr:tetratricopeptide repeat protein [Myxococcales bacterium]